MVMIYDNNKIDVVFRISIGAGYIDNSVNICPPNLDVVKLAVPSILYWHATTVVLLSFYFHQL